jgi:uncharacterized protein YjiS (DUF1127 family)
MEERQAMNAKSALPGRHLPSRPYSAPVQKRLWSILGRCARTLVLWSERWRQREALAELDDDLLRDIGVSRKDARREAQKGFWQ